MRSEIKFLQNFWSAAEILKNGLQTKTKIAPFKKAVL